MLHSTQRLLSVRNRVYLLSPLPPRKRSLSTHISRLTLVCVGIGTFAVLGYSAMVLASLFNDRSSDALTATPQGSPSPIILPPIGSGNGSSSNPSANPGSVNGIALLPSTNANQRSDQVVTGRTNPFTTVRELSVLLPGQVRWNKPRSLANRPLVPPKQLVALNPQTSTATSSKTPGLDLNPLPPQEIPPVPTVQVPKFNPPSSQAFATPDAQPFGNPPVATPGAVALACDVQINGVVQTNGLPMVVLQEKSEENTYPKVVQVGERICKGTVAVSQVIGLGGSQPTVVLDQYGQAIYRPVETTLTPTPKT